MPFDLDAAGKQYEEEAKKYLFDDSNRYAVLDKETGQIYEVRKFGVTCMLEDNDFISNSLMPTQLVDLLSGNKDVSIDLKSK